MPKQRPPAGPADPWETSDPSLALALRELEWLTRHQGLKRTQYMVSEALILLLGAATTLAAALQARPWVTASLAAGSLVLAGVRKIFDWHEDWLAFSGAWAELNAAVNNYRLLPEERRDEDARRQLMNKVNDVISNETDRWSSRRRSLAKAQA